MKCNSTIHLTLRRTAEWWCRFGVVLALAMSSGCQTPTRTVPVLKPVFATPDPKGETHPREFVRVTVPFAPVNSTAPMETFTATAITRPAPRPDWTNPVPMVGTALKFMPRTNSAPIRYVGQWSTNLTNWQTWTNAILDGPPHPFYFLMLDDSSAEKFFRVVWTNL